MDTDSETKFPQIVKQYECPICFRIPRAEIFQCVKGHSICGSCASKVELCPICRAPGVCIRNRLLEVRLDSMKFSCGWKDQGCIETMFRSQLSAHEEQCDRNPNIINVCSVFFRGQNCQFKITPKWLSNPANCTQFINHMYTCHGYSCIDNIKYRNHYGSTLKVDQLQLLASKDIPTRPAHHYFGPRFYRIENLNHEKEQLFFRIAFLKVDQSGNNVISWAFVELTPEVSPTVMQITIRRNTNSEMISKWGNNCLPTLKWTVKPISFDRFTKMLISGQQTTQVKSIFPFSLPVSFLINNYVCDDGRLYDTVAFELLP